VTNRKKQKRDVPAARSVSAAPAFAPQQAIVAEVPRGRMILLVCVAAIAVFIAYANHFHNTFHFDDAHTIENNVYIRDLHNIPLFFKDGSTFSSLPTNQSWRPLVSTSLAIDYKLSHGLNPLWFHISTFFWFLLQLVLMFYLYESVLDAVAPSGVNRYVALFTATVYGMHPAIAETVNYIIQRGDLYSTLGIVAGMVMYIRLPRLRKFGLYLLPVIAGALAKPPAVVFGALLFVYIFLFEENAEWPKFWAALWRSAPALVACAVLAELNIKMTPASYLPTELPHVAYWATQPFVAMRYVRSMFLPLWLSADSDLNPFDGFFDGRALVGLAFCAALAAAAFWMMRRRELRPISFGIFWFFISLGPTSVFVLSEVENDHRMFLPFVGLLLSATWAAFLFVSRAIARRPESRKNIVLGVQIATALILIACGIGTWKRNEVWRSEDSLWRDVTIKSPENGRGLMNYGLTLMGKGDLQGALGYYERAEQYTPNYYLLEINTGIAEGLLNRNQDAEAHFKRAISLQPGDSQPYFFYGRWLCSQRRLPECIVEAKLAIDRNPPAMDARLLLMQAYQDQHDWGSLRGAALDALKIAPGDAQSQQFLANSGGFDTQLATAQKLADQEPTADHLLQLSLLYHEAGRFQECIAAAKRAIAIKPDFPEAYNNLAAAYEGLKQWDDAIAAAQQAIKLKPDFQLAKNNLAYSLQQKRLAENRR
jgi:protein O-mannosyl-transferase